MVTGENISLRCEQASRTHILELGVACRICERVEKTLHRFERHLREYDRAWDVYGPVKRIETRLHHSTKETAEAAEYGPHDAPLSLVLQATLGS